MKTNKKTIITILSLSVFLIGGGYYKNKHSDHVKVQDFSEKLVFRSDMNEDKLYKNRFKLDPSFGKGPTIAYNAIIVDIVIPLVEKDLETAVLGIEAAKKLVMHKIGTIYIVAPDKQNIKDFAAKNHCVFINENDVLPSHKIKKYGGWIIQQFLKLNADTFVKADHYLVFDADTIFLRPVIFLESNGNHIVNAHWNTCPKRKKATAHYIGNEYVYAYDFVAHHMFFSKSILKDMKNHIEKLHSKKWYDVMIDSFEKDAFFLGGFSEYEIYMTYLTEFSKEKFRFVSNANITISREFINRLDKIIPPYSAQYKTISLHKFAESAH